MSRQWGIPQRRQPVPPELFRGAAYGLTVTALASAGVLILVMVLTHA